MDNEPNTYANGTQAGWKGSKATGRQAAFAIAKELPRRQQEVFDALAPYGALGATCDDIAATLGLPVHVVRPRASELEKRRKLWAVGRRPGSMGYAVTVWSTVRPAEPASEAA